MIEVIATTLEDALIIEECGGNRIELIMGFREQGLTPSLALIEKVTSRVKIPVNVMIRPHDKTFVLSKFDVEVMKRDIEIVKNTKANGIVIGAITDGGEIEKEVLLDLLKDKGSLEVTFHACFNYLNNLEKSLSTLDEMKIDNVLTKGGVANVEENMDILKSLVSQNTNVNILIGGGIDQENIMQIKEKTNNTHFHVGTAVRENNSQIEGVSRKKLLEFVKLVK